MTASFSPKIRSGLSSIRDIQPPIQSKAHQTALGVYSRRFLMSAQEQITDQTLEIAERSPLPEVTPLNDKNAELKYFTSNSFPLWLVRALVRNGIVRAWQVLERSPSEFLDMKGIGIKGMTLIEEWQQKVV